MQSGESEKEEVVGMVTGDSEMEELVPVFADEPSTILSDATTVKRCRIHHT